MSRNDIKHIIDNGIKFPNIINEDKPLWEYETNLPWVWVKSNKIIVDLPEDYLKFKDFIMDRMGKYIEEFTIGKENGKEKIIFFLRKDIELPNLFQGLDYCPFSIGLDGLFKTLF